METQHPSDKPNKRAVGRPRLIQKVDPLPKLGIVDNPNSTENIVELSYDNVSIFKKLFSLLKLMNVKEINIQFNPNYTKIYGIDHLEKNLINIKIDSNKLNHYYCEYPINITLDPKNLDKITQKIDKNYNLFSIVLKKNSYRNNLIIILNNKILSIDESHIINLIENDVDLNALYNRSLDYNLYPLRFELPGKYFKKLINDISIFSEIFTIEKINTNPLQFIYKNINNTIKGFNICKDNTKIKLESDLHDDDIFSVSIRIDYIKALSNSLLSDKIKIYADKENDLIFNLLIDNGVFEILVYTSINKYI
jgi:hypothetical protein